MSFFKPRQDQDTSFLDQEPFFRRIDYTPLILLSAMAVMWALLHALIGTDGAGPSAYCTYTLQALSWRQGRLSLGRNYPWLELAIYNGDYYVSFPPLPSLVLLPLTFLFGQDTPDNLLVKLYAAGACLLMYFALRRRGYGRAMGGMLAFLIGFSSSLLPLTLDGAVWFHAQTLAFLLATAAVFFLSEDRPAPALLCYALSVACRPFHALYALPIFFIYLRVNRRGGIPWEEIVRSLLPGVCLGLGVAAGIGIYNFVRFGNPFEFGHNYLPEFSFQGGIQFSLGNIPGNLRTFLLGMPLERTANGWAFKKFGYSMLLACPIVALTLGRCAYYLIRRKMTWEKAVTILAMLLHIFLLLLHRTFGGFQLGARYVVDVIPYCFLYALIEPGGKKWRIAQIAVLSCFFVFTCIGACQVHL